MTFHIDRAAHADLAALDAYYDSQSPRLADAFQAAFRRAARSIQGSPRRHSLAEDEYPGLEVREYYIQRFHQRVLFLVDAERVIVFSVLHASRRPGAWHRRLDTFQ